MTPGTLYKFHNGFRIMAGEFIEPFSEARLVVIKLGDSSDFDTAIRVTTETKHFINEAYSVLVNVKQTANK